MSKHLITLEPKVYLFFSKSLENLVSEQLAWVLARWARKERKFLARRENLLVPDGFFFSSPEYRSVNRAVSNVEGLKLKITAHKIMYQSNRSLNIPTPGNPLGI